MRAADPLPPRTASTGSATAEQARAARLCRAGSAREQPAARCAAGRSGGVGIQPGDEQRSPNRIHGRVFATSPSDGDYSCSGTAVNSPGRSLVVTAGHCVYLNGEWGVNFMFVPGYRDGRSPYGRWAGTKLRAPPQWVAAENISFDIGMVTVSRNLSGRAVQDVVGARGIGFNQPRNQTYTSYGYPAEPPFDGESLQACRSQYQGEDPSTDPPRTMRIDLRHERRSQRRRLGRREHAPVGQQLLHRPGPGLPRRAVRASTAPTSQTRRRASTCRRAAGRAAAAGAWSPSSAARGGSTCAASAEPRRDQPARRRRRGSRRRRARRHLRRPGPRRAARRPRAGRLHRRPGAG